MNGLAAAAWTFAPRGDPLPIETGSADRRYSLSHTLPIDNSS